jgi:hypothetical protein
MTKPALAFIPLALLVGCVADVSVHVEATATDGDNDTDDCVPEPEDHPAVCMDGVDNDCDGFVDCEQPECNMQFPECSCTGESEDHPAACMDGFDNDCDGLVDCEEPVCHQVLPECGQCQVIEQDCFDNVDNDCNGMIDCRDPNCEPECDAMMCQPEDHPIVCQDAADNDCDGLVNCMDPQCQSLGMCTQCGNAMLDPGEECDGPDLGGNSCVTLGYSGGALGCTPMCTLDTGMCTMGMCVAEVCNGIDDDCDMSIDEGNPGGGMPCGSDVGECVSGIMTCVAGALQCAGAMGPQPEDHPIACADGVDNDCDGALDCADPNCVGMAGCP